MISTDAGALCSMPQRPHDFQRRQQHPQCHRSGRPRRHGVGMRTDQDGTRAPGSRPARRPIRLPAVSIRVPSPASSKRAPARRGLFEKARRKRAAGVGLVRIGDGGEGHRVVPDPVGVHGKIVAGMGPRSVLQGGRRRCWPELGQHSLPSAAITVAAQERCDQAIRQFDTLIGAPGHKVVAAAAAGW